jgi:hypothetical protein
MGKDGQLIAPQQIYDLLGLVDWDIYRELIGQMYAKGVLYNTMTKAKKSALAKIRNRSNRAIARLAVRQPDAVEQGLSELYGCLARTGQVPTIDGPWLTGLLEALPSENPYRTLTLSMVRLLRLLNMVDDSSHPTSLLQTLWSAAPPGLVGERRIAEAQRSPTARSSGLTPRLRATSNKGPSDGRTGAAMDIYVGNLAYDTTEQQVFHHFQQCGQVLNVGIPKDLTSGEGRGFAFVKMANRESAKLAIEQLDGSAIRGRRIRLDWAR